MAATAAFCFAVALSVFARVWAAVLALARAVTAALTLASTAAEARVALRDTDWFCAATVHEFTASTVPTVVGPVA